MKTKKLFIISILTVIIGIIFYLNYYFYQYKKPFDINSLDLSGWNKSDYNLSFLFPLDNIPVCKKFTNSYESNSNIFKQNYPNTREPISSSEIENQVNAQPEVKSIINQLKKQKFKKIERLSGLSQGNYGVTYENIRYLITYQKGNIFCQIHETFECASSGCYGIYSYFGCGQFDLEKDFQSQKQYYDIYQLQSKKLFNTEYFYNIQENGKYIFFDLNQMVDGRYIYINKQDNKVVCANKVCCSSYAKDDPTLYGDWCADDYQAIETYQSVGL